MHVLLGDIGMEEERFDSSATDYEAALQLLTQALEAGPHHILCFCPAMSCHAGQCVSRSKLLLTSHHACVPGSSMRCVLRHVCKNLSLNAKIDDWLMQREPMPSALP